MGKKRSSRKLRASVLAILLVISMTVGMVPGGMGEVHAADTKEKVKTEEQTGFIDKAKNFLSDIGDGINGLFEGENEEAKPAAALDETSVVDANTSQGWQGIVENNTQNIGRIWTDKSVYNSNVTLPGIGDGASIPITKPEDSDFMVGLSALSSTSNTSVTTSTPLDIVLVLDVSGSMEDGLGTKYDYTEAYKIDTSGSFRSPTYYALDNQTGQYVKIKRVTRWDTSGFFPQQVFDHWELNGVTVVPKTGQNDNDSSHTQFYTREEVTVSKMDGLKTAVNGFIDVTAKQNESITDPDKKHHISVVKYADDSYYRGNQDNVGDKIQNNGYNYSQIVSKLTGDMASLKSAVNGLNPGGATAADYGMTLADRVFNSSAGHGVRANAKKVVVMFTDGEPNHSNGFSDTVANAAITSAKALKDAGVLVYSIGVVSGADPEDTSRKINAYLHGISSNYPNATGYQSLGERAANSNYYKAATNSEELNNIFQEISNEINTGTGYPTETEEGFANKDGYVTFHDQLGDYMQVDSFNKLVLEDMVFKNPTEKETAGSVTYTYSGSVGEGKNVSDIVITVTKGTGSMGDTVDVRIPAALLPLRHFKVDVTKNTMTVDNKYPLRLFYNASLKEDAKKALANPDQAMKNYITSNLEDGKVYFYSNKFTGSKQGLTESQTLGDTTATFEPASGNSFYYFIENTMLYVDQDMTKPLTSYNADGTDTYYYAKTYYESDNGTPKEVTEAVSFRSHPRDEVEDWVGTATDGQLYIKKGAPRLTRIHDLTSGKENNATGTATEVITPNWDDEQAQRNIEVSLGNNGRLAVELPGTLEIKKTVTSEVNVPDKDFTFKLTLKNKEEEALTGEFDAQKFNAQGVASGDPVKVQNNGTVTLKDGESVKIYGLSNGDTYSIEETNIPKGFTAKENPITGKIAGNETVTAAFENTYAVTPAVLDGDSSIRAKKTLTERDWANGDSFEIVLRAQSGAPLPEESKGITIDTDNARAVRTVTENGIFSFGKITFDKPGRYVYNVAEPAPTPDKEIPGINYSGAVYRVDVEVTDNGEGVLSARSTMTRVLDEMGQAIEDGGTIVDNGIASFTNKFEADSVEWGAQARKIYVDKSGAKPLQRGNFTFRVEAVQNDTYTEKGPLPGGADFYEVTNGIGGEISFGQATFGTEHHGKTYLYKISEVVPEGVTAKNPTKDGMTYDTNVYYLELSFGSTENPYDPDKEIMTVTPKYMDADMEVIPNLPEMVFTNTYEPTPVTIGDTTTTAIKGSKTLNGRAMKADEFSFELTAENQAATDGLADDSIVFGEEKDSVSMTVNAPQADKGVAASFDFGKITFTKPGTYTFNMKEVIPDQAAGGLTYDTHTEVVTVTVTDNNGVLEANTTYDENGAAFVNTYEASHSYSADGGVLVTKTLTGRDMKAGEFNFTIKGTGDNAEAAEKKLAETDKTFTHYAAKAGVASPMRKLQNVSFTEADAGQTFTYLIKEVIPEDDKKVSGVIYDQSEFTVAIAVADDGDGTMSTTTTVTRTKKDDGTNTIESLGVYSNAEDIVAVPFVNKYQAGSVTVDTTATANLRKVLRGRDWKADDSFTFTMTPIDNAPMPAENPEAGITSDGKGGLQAVVTADAETKAGTRVYFGFGSITYDRAGTYVYTVTENKPESPAGGMTYSENVVTITVNVTDPGTGQLEETVRVSGTINNRTFYNDYTASLRHNAAGGIETTKTLTGHDMAKQQFAFQVEALDGTGTTAAENAKRIGLEEGTTGTYRNDRAAKDGEKITMKTADGNDIEFTTKDIGKTLKYKFSEMGADGQFGTGGTKDGYTYDKTVYTVELWVTDDGDGTLTLHTRVNDGEEVVSDEKNPVETVLDFTNSYAASGTLGGKANLEVTKNLAGREWIESDSFSFKLEATGDTVEAVKGNVVTLPGNANGLVIDAKDKDKKASFGDITFTKPGTYTFQVTEVVPEDADNNVLNGITYDNSVKNITVNVTDKGNGTLAATIAENSDKLEFTNRYTTSTVTLNDDQKFKVTKKLVGREWTDDDAFEFKLTAKEGIPMPAEGEALVTATKAQPTQTFGVITYTKAGKYSYTIAETVPSDKEEDMTYDTHKATVTVIVSEDKTTGTLSIQSVTYSDGTGGAQFTNVLGKNTKEVTSENQNVDNGMVGVGDELTYTINWVNDGVNKDGAPEAATVTITDKIPAGTEFVSADNGGELKDGTVTWTIDAKAAATGSVSFTVKVTDAAAGSNVLNKAEVQVGENDPKVTNEVETFIPGKKSEVQEGGELQVGSELTYTISYKNPEKEKATVIITDKIPTGLDYVEGSAGENASYDAETGILTWTLTDVPAGQEGSVTFKAKVNESAVEKVENQATIQIGENGPKYETNTDEKELAKVGELAISKTIKLTDGQGTEIDATKEFTFTVSLKDREGKPLNTDYDYTITKGEDKVKEAKVKDGGTILLKHGETATIKGLPAGARYTVTEATADGYKTSVGDQEGNVAAGSIVALKTAKADFTNTYSATGVLGGSDKLTVVKEFTGREGGQWLESDKFTFKLETADDKTKAAIDAGLIKMPENAEITIDSKTEGHKKAFANITFNTVGEFNFKVTENPSKIVGVTDDKDNVRDIHVTVSDNHDGTLKVEVTGDNLTFKNTYGAGMDGSDIAAQIEANKILHGRKMSAKEFNFEVVTRAAKDTGVFKAEVVAKGTNAAAKEDAKGKVTFAGASETASRPLTYTTESLNQAVTDGYAVKDVVDGKAVWTMNYTARELTEELPTGIKADKMSFDFMIVVTDNNDGTLKAEVQYPENGIVFENSYATGGTEVDTNPTEASAYFHKVLTGRNWLENDAFTFTIEPQNGAPAPEKATVTVTSKEAKAEESVPFGFGKISFTDADMEGAVQNADGTLSKTFTYVIKENDIDVTKMPGVTKDGHTATLTITVTDNQKGQLSATAGAVTVENGTFTNRYVSGLDYNALGGLQITKVLHGRDMEAGQFTFTVTPKDADSAKKLGFDEVKAYEFKNKAAEAEAVDTIDVLEGKSVTFTQADAGKTYTYTIAETKGENAAYTYDVTPRTVTIEVVDNKDATLTVTTTVTKDGQDVDKQSVTTGEAGKKATVAFENTYNDKQATLGGEGNVTIRATKSLTNRPLESGEFTFNVYDKNGDKVTTGKNTTDGTIAFNAVEYTTDKLIKDVKAGIASVNKDNAPVHVYTYEYEVVEAPTTDGVTGIATSFRITVLVTDDGNGELKIEVVYPEGKDPLPFENAYGTSANAEVNVNGQKNYVKESGNNAPDITGKYHFTISGSEGAPMPEKTEVTNDRTGNVDFGKIYFTMENVFGKDTVTEEVTESTEEADVEKADAQAEGEMPEAEDVKAAEITEEKVKAAGAETKDADDEITPVKSQERKKTYTYTVKESGNVLGVDNDSKVAKTFTVTVRDNGDGTISVEKSWEKFAFEFTNTYRVDSVDYDMNTDLTIKKELSGREMKEGEFTFELVDSDNQVIATATNKADGTVVFDKTLNYKEPGVYNYVIREQQGTAGGVQYDSAEYTVAVGVTDNGDGTLSAKAETKSRGEIVFKNIYETTSASVTLGASKVYEGNELKDEQFTFVLKDKDGKVVSKAKNTANGQVAFETITYDEEGTYEYTISEKNDKQKNVTYDEAVYKVTVTVTDNGEGSLLAEVTYADGKAPVFTNKYTKPVDPKPEKPEKPQKPTEPQRPSHPKTGDEAPIIGLVVLMVIALAAIVTVCIIFFKKRKRG